jgi:integrase
VHNRLIATTLLTDVQDITPDGFSSVLPGGVADPNDPDEKPALMSALADVPDILKKLTGPTTSIQGLQRDGTVVAASGHANIKAGPLVVPYGDRVNVSLYQDRNGRYFVLRGDEVILLGTPGLTVVTSKVNFKGRVMNDGAVTFGWFVRNRFLPLKEANWKPETAKVKKLLIQKDLIDTFDHMPIESFDRFTLQVHLNKLAKTRSKDRVLQMRAYVRDIFAEAVEQDFLAKDPARKVTVPTQLRDTDKTTLTWEQLRNALSHLALRDRILLELDMTNALRPSELFALRWKCFDQAESKMYVFETTYKGAIRPWGKTKKSLGRVHLPKELADDLWLWKQECPDSSPEAFIFPDAKGGFMDTGNYAGGCCTSWRGTSNYRS